MFCFSFGNRVFTAFWHSPSQQRCLEGNGMGGLDDADLIGVAWAMFAAAASLGLVVVAIAFARASDDEEHGEYCAAYNAMAHITGG